MLHEYVGGKCGEEVANQFEASSARNFKQCTESTAIKRKFTRFSYLNIISVKIFGYILEIIKVDACGRAWLPNSRL